VVETGITVDGVPLEEHLEDKKRKGFFKSIEKEIREDKKLIYNTHKTKCQAKYDTKPGKVRHILIPKSGAEIFLDYLTRHNWCTINEIYKDFKNQIGKRALAQAVVRCFERYPQILRKRSKGHENEYALITQCNFTSEDLINLWRKNITFENLVAQYPDLEFYLQNAGSATIVKDSIQDQLKDLHLYYQRLEENLALLEKKMFQDSKIQTIEAGGQVIIKIYTK
jgi:hypothetical protein